MFAYGLRSSFIGPAFVGWNLGSIIELCPLSLLNLNLVDLNTAQPFQSRHICHAYTGYILPLTMITILLIL